MFVSRNVVFNEHEFPYQQLFPSQNSDSPNFVSTLPPGSSSLVPSIPIVKSPLPMSNPPTPATKSNAVNVPCSNLTISVLPAETIDSMPSDPVAG